MYDNLNKFKRGNKALFTNFKDKPYFTKQDLVTLADKFSISETSLNTLIQRSIKDKTIIPLKRNYYVTQEFVFDNQGNLEYKFLLANILLKPSYISRETALQYYGLLSESIVNYYTSTTSKVTRRVTNSLGIYEYKSIKEDLFFGFKTIQSRIDNHEYFYMIAEPYKAIYDYLHYRTNKKKIRKSELFATLEQLRIDYHSLPKNQIIRLTTLFK